MPTPRQLTATSIPGLDELLGGGIPRRQAVLVTGEPGTGKTILCSQIAFQQAAQGIPVIIASVTSEPHDKLLDALSEFDFFDGARVGQEVFLLSVYSALKAGTKEARELLTRTVRERKAKLLFVDGLRALRDLWQDESKLRDFLYGLNASLAASDCLALYNTEYPLERLLQYPEATTLDGLISLSVQSVGARRIRRLEVVKLRGRPHLQGEHAFAIDRRGVSVIPRLEATAPDDRDVGLDSERAGFGHPELDALMGGGLPRPGVTVLAGSMGIGKTLLALYFASHGASVGEPTYFLTMHEPVGVLTARASRIGLDLSPGLASGKLHLEYLPPADREADVVIARVLDEAKRLGARRVVIDGLARLEQAIVDPHRRETLLGAFVVALRRAGISAVLTREVAKVAGPELDFSDTPIASVCENLILLRYLEMRGQIHRIVSVLKMRDSRYDPHVREFEIASNGLRVLAPVQSAHGLLTGTGFPVEPHRADGESAP